MAAASYLSTSGKGNAGAIANSIGRAQKAGATDAEVGSAWETAKASYRASGRGDVVGEMNRQAGVPNVGGATFTPAATSNDLIWGWGEISAEKVNRESLIKNPNGADSYKDYLVSGTTTNTGKVISGAEATRQALEGYDRMEARAKAAATKFIVNAAILHKGGAVTDIQTAKAAFGVK